MRVIRSRIDLECLRAAGALPGAYVGLVERDFERALGGTEPGGGPGAYDPDENGFFVVLEPGDNVRDLGVVGLNPGDGGLLGCWPEFVDRIELGPGLSVYRVLVLYNNECAMTFYLQAGQWDREVERWLRDNANDGRDDKGKFNTDASGGTLPDEAGVPF